jgi:DNA repair protein RecO (recombination protein O)
MPTIKDTAIVLRLVDWSETSQIVGLLTREHGKIAATAKGSKRQTPSVMAKFSGGLELATRGEAVLITRTGRELATLTEWDLVAGHWRLRRDLRAFELAMYAIDLAHHLLQEQDPHPASFDALAVFLEAIGGGGAAAPASEEPHRRQAALLRLQWALVADAGYAPVLDRDATTGEVLDEGGGAMAFSPTAGGFVTDASDRWKVRRGTHRALGVVAAGGSLTALTELDEASIERANRLLCAYCRAILDRQLPTMRAVLRGRGVG